MQLAGVVLNRVGSERHRALLAEALASISVPLLGVLPQHPSLDLPSRHLGLLPPQELDDLGERQRLWAQLAEEHLDLERLWPLLEPPAPQQQTTDPISWVLSGLAAPKQAPAQPPQGPDQPLGQAPTERPTPLPSQQPLPVAIATDAAFLLYYYS